MEFHEMIFKRQLVVLPAEDVDHLPVPCISLTGGVPW